jgi:hypothetical protein
MQHSIQTRTLLDPPYKFPLTTCSFTTTSGGLMWPDHLNTTYNRGSYKVYNFACSTATTSRNIVRPTSDTLADGSYVLTQEDQVANFFLLNGLGGLGIPWKSNNSLFFFSGTTTGNDVLSSANDYPYNTTLLPTLVDKWRYLAKQVIIICTLSGLCC